MRTPVRLAERSHPPQIVPGQWFFDPQHRVLAQPLHDVAGAGGIQAALAVAGHPPPLVEVRHDRQALADHPANGGDDGQALGDPTGSDPHLDGAEALLEKRVSVLGPLPRFA